YPLTLPRPPRPTLFPYTTLFRSLTRATAASRSWLACQKEQSGGTSILNFFSASIWPSVGLRPLCQPGSRLAATSIRSNGSTAWEIGEHTSELQSRFDLVCRLLLE